MLKLNDLISVSNSQQMYGTQFSRFKIYHDVTKSRYYIKVNEVNGVYLSRLAPENNILVYSKVGNDYIEYGTETVRANIDGGMTIFIDGPLPGADGVLMITHVKRSFAVAVAITPIYSFYGLYDSGNTLVDIGKFPAQPQVDSFSTRLVPNERYRVAEVTVYEKAAIDTNNDPSVPSLLIQRKTV